jgi:transcriptional regulator with XRE-family HTH domain
LFGSNLKKFREQQLEISQEKLAESLMVKSQNAISQYERGERDPSIEQLKILHSLGCDLNWLIADVAPPKKDEIESIRRRFEELEKSRDVVKNDMLDALSRCEENIFKKEKGK